MGHTSNQSKKESENKTTITLDSNQNLTPDNVYSENNMQQDPFINSIYSNLESSVGKIPNQTPTIHLPPRKQSYK